ncbi:hypothetical protein ACHQM5_001546 [Ranunculus cassubicifolius]
MENPQETTTLPFSNPQNFTVPINPEPIRTMPLPINSSAITSFSLTRPEDYPTNGGGGGGFNLVNSEPLKRKRGRPRKYSGGQDGGSGMAMAMSPLSSGAGAATPHSRNGPNESSYKPKSRGKNVGVGKKQQLDAICSAGRGFTAQVIVVKSGDDVASKIMSFSQQGTNTTCILSANGAVSNVTLRQPATYGGTVSYEGRFEIISLSGSFMHVDSGGTRSRTGGMSVSLAGTDGRVMGGGVAGMLIAATPVQVVIGSFSAEDHLKSEQPVRESSLPTTSPYMMGFGTPAAVPNPPFPNTYSGSSEDTGSPIDWNSRACNDIEQSNHQGNFIYSGHGQEPYIKFPSN